MKTGSALALLALGLAACSSGGDTSGTATAAADIDPVTTVTSKATVPSVPATATPTTVKGAAPSTAKPAPAPPPGVGPGANSPEIQAMEAKLDSLKYSVGKIDGVYDSMTVEGVIAFQKVKGMARTGRATPEVMAAVQAASAPEPMIPDGGGNRVEIDLKRQVLFLYQGGALTKTLMISSGGNYRYCSRGSCSRAVTPGGSYRVGTKIKGKHVAPLGVLYNPLFFNGGIAIHGSPSVPTHPASHGCIRIPMSQTGWFYNTVTRGTAVYVFTGSNSVTALPDPPPPTSTTTAPPAPAPSPTTAPPAPTTTAPPATSTTLLPTTTTTAPTSTTSSSTPS